MADQVWEMSPRADVTAQMEAIEGRVLLSASWGEEEPGAAGGGTDLSEAGVILPYAESARRARARVARGDSSGGGDSGGVDKSGGGDRIIGKVVDDKGNPLHGVRVFV